MFRYALLIGFFLLSFYVVRDLVKKPEVATFTEDDLEVKPKKTKRYKRLPASLRDRSTIPARELYKPSYRQMAKDDRNFAPVVEADERISDSPAATGNGYSEGAAPSPSSGGRSYSASRNSDSSSRSKKSASASQEPQSWNSVSVSAPSEVVVGSTTTTGGSNGDSSSTTTSGGSGGGFSSNQNSLCTMSVNQGAGTYNSPILVSITSSAAGSIYYSLNEGSCVNPSNTYSGNFVVGANDGQYCLSYSCEDTSGRMSDVFTRNYTITSGAPALQASHPKIQYQTTELVGVSYLTSQDFGREDFEIGQVNLRFDPGANGCDYLYENYVMYPPSTPPSPSPFQILAALEMNSINPNSQLEIPLLPGQLDYGDNFIMSYVADLRDSTSPQYVCSTQKIVLEDFEYFEAYPLHGDPGTSTVREYSGGFSPYGFFEEETVLFRGPAGVSEETQDGQSLESGLFQIFF